MIKPFFRLGSFVVFAISLAGHLSAATYAWNANSGLYPDQVPAPMRLQYESPTAPQLGSNFLTLSTGAEGNTEYYINQNAELNMPTVLEITARFRYISGTGVIASRAPFTIGFGANPNAGNELMLGPDIIFLLANDQQTRGQSAVIDTDDAFHDYRIEVNFLTGAIGVYYDSATTPVLTGSTFALNFGVTSEIFWGDGTLSESGVSEWQSFTHNAAAVPEPSTWMALAAGGVIATVGVVRRHAHLPAYR